ncbi:hypothetical protein GNP92_15055 [Paenibacillus timonensis]|nr:hypothetical protein [Paenibacillus timonensis]
MAEVHGRVVPTGYRSPVEPPKEKNKKTDTGQLRGFVKLYNTEKQFGFIAVKGGPDVFFHLSTAGDADTAYFMQGDRVTFEIGEDKRGKPTAKNVRLVQ